MAVGIHRDGDVGVSQELLDVLGMLALHEEYCSARVPEIVQPDGRQPSPPQEGVKVAAQEVIRYLLALLADLERTGG